MMRPEQDETRRLEALDRLDVLDSPREDIFDSLSRLVCRLLKVPMSAVSMIDGHRQWYKASEGLASREAPLQDTFCIHALHQGSPLVVPDALDDARFAANPFVTGAPHIRSYASIPLTTHGGQNIGTVCAIGNEPRPFTEDDIACLGDIARIAMELLESRQLANSDALTGTLSRRAFKDEGAGAVALAQRHHHALSLIMLDLDHFKAINDNWGHPVGDAVISGAVRACRSRLRRTDLVGRIGGEEFAFLLPHTDGSGALRVAEDLRQAVAALDLEAQDNKLNVTASLGVASLDASAPDLETLLAAADAALYRAKQAGRNRCVLAEPAGGKRDSQWRRVLKGGQIVFNNRRSTVDCTIRGLSETGARIDISSTQGLPKDFILSIRGDGIEIPSRVTHWGDRNLEVEFSTAERGSPQVDAVRSH